MSGGMTGQIATIPEAGLENAAMLAPLDSVERQRLSQLCDWREIAAGEAITDPDDDSGAVYFLAAGRARVVNLTLLGNPVTLSDLMPGTHFGELSAFDGGPRSATVLAVEPCVVGAMPREDFFTLISENPRVLRPLLERLAGMVRSTNERVMQHALL